MPTYEYLCPDGHQFERFQKMSDRARVKCPDCGQTASRRISGGAGLVFKGSGFYITDYGKDGKGPRKDEKAVAEPAKDTAKPSGDKAEAAKPAKPAGSAGSDSA